MSSSSPNSPGYDEEDLSSTKIAPLDSPSKTHVGHEHTHGVIGEDYILQSSHIDPFKGNEKMGDSQMGGHHVGHHQRRDQHHDRTDTRGQQKHVTQGGKAAMTDEGTMGVGMRMGENVVDHTKGGMPMRKE
ncbi:hypothetical protein K440DRAFT_627461 [Wilcoxina mikolae CBS 423.85]|nr:hypothetical protein K440DRAFT_627461 [Wilcoxina mikolae CBS 423.85]